MDHGGDRTVCGRGDKWTGVIKVISEMGLAGLTRDGIRVAR